MQGLQGAEEASSQARPLKNLSSGTVVWAKQEVRLGPWVSGLGVGVEGLGLRGYGLGLKVDAESERARGWGGVGGE